MNDFRTNNIASMNNRKAEGHGNFGAMMLQIGAVFGFKSTDSVFNLNKCKCVFEAIIKKLTSIQKLEPNSQFDNSN